MWYKGRNILLTQAGADGGNGGGGSEYSFTPEDSFSDADDFDLSKLGGGKKEKDPQLTQTPDKSGQINKKEKEGVDNNGKKVNIPDEEDEDHDDLEKQLELEAKEKGVSTDELKKKKEEEKNVADEKEKIVQKELDDLSKKLEKEGKSKEEIKKAIDEKKQQIAEEEFDNEINPFKSYKPTEEKPAGTEKIDYTSLVKDAELEVEEGTEIKSKDDYIKVLKKNIEKAKQTIDLSAFPPEARMIIENLKKNNNLFLTDFYRNESIRSIDNFLSLPDDRKIKNVLAEDGKRDGRSGQDLIDYVNEKFTEMTEVDISSKVKEINRQAAALKTREYNKIINEKNKFIEEGVKKEIARAAEERQTLVAKMKDVKEFMGFPIPENTLLSMQKEIESGAFQTFLDQNVEDAKINAYIVTKLGKQFKEAYAKLLKISKSEAYKKGLETLTKQKHNIRTQSGNLQTGGRKSGDLAFADSMFEEE